MLFRSRNAITTPDVPFTGELFSAGAAGKHPLVLAANEGLVVQTPIGNGQAAGVSKWAFTMEWAEVAAY